MSCSRINLASSVTGVSGLTQSTPLCITSLTFMADSVAEVCVSAPVPSPLPLYDRLGPQETNGGSVGSSLHRHNCCLSRGCIVACSRITRRVRWESDEVRRCAHCRWGEEGRPEKGAA